MFNHISTIKRLETLQPNEVMAGFIWYRALNSKDHFFKIPYYEYPCYFEYSNDNDAYMLDVYYMKQEHAFMLLQPDWKSVLCVSGQVLEWLESVHASAPVVVKPKRQRRGQIRRPISQPSVPGSLPLQQEHQHE